MKLNKISIIALAFAAGLTSCSDWLEQDPPSQLTPDGFMDSETKVQAAANQFYTDVLPSHGSWSYGIYGNDDETDNQVDWYPDSKYGTGLWLTGSTNSNWAWENIRNINYQLNAILEMYNAGSVSGSDTNIRQYIGEIYFFRAYCYFDMLQKWGDLPIITEALPDEESVLVAANKRQPRNEVARFIINTLDTATTYLKEDFESRHTRVSYDVALLLKSRVALFEGSWLTNFKGTAFVPQGTGWPGAAKDYNKDYQYPTGSIDSEATYFFEQAADAAEKVAEKYKGNLVTNTGVVPQSETDAENPYLSLWGTDDMSGTPEILLWREYSRSLSITNNIEVAVHHGNYSIGLTKSMVEGYLMKDGKPIYASDYTYSDNTLADVATNRDPRLTVFLKLPGQKNYYKNVESSEGDHAIETEPYPEITNHDVEGGYSTGYAIRKGGMFDKAVANNGSCYNAAAIFRATEALLNYIEAEYMLTKNINSGKILEYWQIVREKAGFTGTAVDPNVTINATDMSKETQDWGAYTAGTVLTDKVLYNIRRERRCELLAEGLREMDLKRWRSFDQLISTPVHVEGMHLYNTAMTSWYTDLITDGSSSANVSSPDLGEYIRPHEINMTNNNYVNGLTWHMAHYLQPLPIRQFLLTATDYASVDQSPLYQNPYWPTSAGEPAEE
ncbi:MAG: RagB/SusD family nutrient uptake outer membrane protein [Prevotellaceae bacterium]|nr:RagB/SusD family nutrient uptake outer membrane protein [Prevotellaceae bacterium]